MKKVFLSFVAASIAVASFAQDDAVLQPKGSWYLGSANATDIFKIFSNDGMNVDPFVGYAIADNIAITLGVNLSSITIDEPSLTQSFSEISVGAAYFFGDNFFGQAGVTMGATDDGNENTTSMTSIGLALGKYIPVRDMWYVSPSLGFNTVTMDGGSGSGAALGITFGARL